MPDNYGERDEVGSSSSSSIGKNADYEGMLYSTLTSHPPPLEHPVIVLSLLEVSKVTSTVSNDELFSNLLERLQAWCDEEEEGEYVMIVLAAAKELRKRPGMGWWFWKWRRIPRRYVLVFPNEKSVDDVR